MTLLEFRVLGRLSTSVLGALDSVVGIAELESLKGPSCLGLCILPTQRATPFISFQAL